MSKLWSAESDTLVLEIHADESPESPRDWEGNLGTLVAWHRRYTLGEEQLKGDAPKRWLHEWTRGRKPEDYVVLPVHMMDHSGIALQTTGFTGPHALWDSGQVGYIYATRKRAEELGAPWENVKEQLASEVEVYSQYVSGEVYGYVLKRKLECGHWEEDDSNHERAARCWGFYGTDWESNGMADNLPDDARPLLKELS